MGNSAPLASLIVKHVVVFAWITIAFLALLYTLFRLQPPLWLRPGVMLMYQASAPFQTYSTYHQDLTASGRNLKGDVFSVDLDPYYPFRFGERQVRIMHASFPETDPVRRTQSYQTLAEKLLRAEQAAGRDITELTLAMERWPMSPQGFDSLRSSDTEVIFTVTAP